MSLLLGHVGYTVVSFLFTFWLITFVVLHEVPWGGSNSGSSGDHYDSDGSRNSVGGGGGNDIMHKNNNPWGMPHQLFSMLRTSLAIASAISTFRTIRRQRRVWLRHPSSSRQQELLLEADHRACRFVLGSELWTRMRKSYSRQRDRYLARNIHRKLLGAQRMFEKRHRKRVKLIRSVSASLLLSEDGGVATPTETGNGTFCVNDGGDQPCYLPPIFKDGQYHGHSHEMATKSLIMNEYVSLPPRLEWLILALVPVIIEIVTPCRILPWSDQMPFAHGEVRSKFCQRFHFLL